MQDIIKVTVIDDDILYRESLKKILAKDEKIRIYGEFNSAIPFMSQLYSPFVPDVCLIDLVLPEMSGLECGKIIKANKPDIHVIIMTAHPSPESLSQAKQINADYIQKGTIGEVLIDKIVTYHNSEKEIFFSVKRNEEKKSESVMNVMKQFEIMQKNYDKLSKSQKEVLKLRKQDKSIKEIAKLLNLQPGTVATHLRRGIEKLEIPNLLAFLDMND